jgi:hypothetical protein
VKFKYHLKSKKPVSEDLKVRREGQCKGCRSGRVSMGSGSKNKDNVAGVWTIKGIMIQGR